MNQTLSIRSALVLGLALLGNSAHAEAKACDAPPFGDTPQNYKSLMDSTANQPRDLPPNFLAAQVWVMLETACKAKFEGGSRIEFRKNGISNKDIDSLGTAALTAAWFSARNRALLAQKTSQPVGFENKSVIDFMAEGPDLARRGAKVHVNGFYVLYGNVPAIFTNQSDAIMAQYNNGRPPMIPILLDQASSDLRRKIIVCDAKPYEYACAHLEVYGSASMCVLNGAFGATSNTPCVVADH